MNEFETFLNEYKSKYKNVKLTDDYEDLTITFEEMIEILAEDDFDNVENYKELYCDDVYIETPNNYSKINYFIKKEKMNIIEIKTKNKSVKVSEYHLFPQPDFSNIYAKDVEKIITKDGIEEVEKEFYSFDNTCDLNIDTPHLYYDYNGILHHNTAALMDNVSNYLLKGEDILYVTLEMPEMEIAKRIDANLMNIPIGELKHLTFEEYQKRMPKKLGKLIIKEYPAGTFNTIKLNLLLKELYSTNKGFNPKIIAIDYIGIMNSSRVELGKAGSYLFYKSISEELHGFAKEYDKIILTAHQLGRAAYDNLDAGAETISDSIGIFQTADLVIALLSTEELRNENKMAFKYLKNRYTGYLGTDILNVDFSRMKFTDTEEMLSKIKTESPDVEINKGIPKINILNETNETNIQNIQDLGKTFDFS